MHNVIKYTNYINTYYITVIRLVKHLLNIQLTNLKVYRNIGVILKDNSFTNVKDTLKVHYACMTCKYYISDTC